MQCEAVQQLQQHANAGVHLGRVDTRVCVATYAYPSPSSTSGMTYDDAESVGNILLYEDMLQIQSSAFFKRQLLCTSRRGTAQQGKH